MTLISKAVRAVLSGNTAVASVVSTRISPESRQQGDALPCIIYAISEDESAPTLSGSGGFRKAQIEVMAVADSAATAADVHEKARTALHKFAGTSGGVSVMHSLHLRSVTSYQSPQAGETAGAFLHTGIYSIMYSET